MAAITNRDDFTDYCLRRLGFPVININVDPDTVQQRIDDAIQYWTYYHYDGTQQLYYIYRITDQDCANRYIDLSNVTDSQNNSVNIVGVTRIFPVTDSQATVSMFDLRYQLRLNELMDFTSASYINYTLTQSHLRSLEIMFTGEVPIRYNMHMRRLFIDWSWSSSEAPPGTIVVAQCYATINPDVYNMVWDDWFLKEYATALIKRDWGNNMKKFGGMQLPGGITLNGDQVYNEAVTEIERLEKEMENSYGGVLEFFMN